MQKPPVSSVDDRQRLSWIDRVDPDSLADELQRGAPRHLVHGRLAHLVGQRAGVRPEARDAGHVNDGAAGFERGNTWCHNR